MGESLRFAFVMPQLGSVSIRLVAAISRFPFADFNALPSISQPRMATGHLNPSLPLARSLIQLGHEVHYLSRAWSRVLSHEVSESGRGSCVLLGTSRFRRQFELPLRKREQASPMLLRWPGTFF